MSYNIYQRKYLDVIQSISGIQFVSFEKVTDLWIARDPYEKISDIAIVEHTDQEILDWVYKIIEDEKIQGEYILKFDIESVIQPPFARVILAENKMWVKDLWNISHAFYFVSPRHDYILFIQWSEYCLSGNCYLAYRGEPLS